jgi:hypothetical protein
MRFIKTSHYRLVNLLVALMLLAALLNARVFEPALLPQYKGHLLTAALLVAALCFIFVRPAADLRPLKIPHLSRSQIRVVSGVLLAICTVSLANYYVLEPGYFTPYKKQVLVASFAIMGLFVLLYAPLTDVNAERERDKGSS